MNLMECKLGDLGKIVGGSTPSTKDAENYGGNIPWITPKDLTNLKERYIERGERNITEKGYNSTSTKMLPPNSILFSSRAPIGYIAINKKAVCTNQGFKSIIPNSKVNYMFLYYLLKYNKNNIEVLGSGTTFKEISGSVMKNIKIDIPERIEDQIKIAKILSNIDEKIELNNHINNNLLEICKSIFKEWFVNYNYPKNNGVMKDSSLGKIPSEWDICKVQEISKIKRGASPRPIQNYISNSGVNWLKISDVTGIKEPFIYNIKEKIKEEGKEKSYFIKKGTLVVSNSATPGIPKFIEVDTCVHDGWLVLYDYKYYYKYFIYFLILNIRDKLLRLSNGSIFQNLKTDILKQFEFVNPTKEILTKFSEIIESPMNKVKQNCEENIKLEQIRDTLLPKLMNGEIDIDKIEI